MNRFLSKMLVFCSLWAGSSSAVPIDFSTVFPTLNEAQSVTNTAQMTIDPAMLTLKHDHNVSVYFISEGAAFKNSFGWYDALTNPTESANRHIIWNNASGVGPGLSGGGSLNMGERYELGLMTAGTRLGFFLTANGYYTGTNGTHYFTDELYNPDGLQHVIAGLYPEFGMVALGFEDIFGGGDLDYNDLLVAIDFGVANTQVLLSSFNASASVPLSGTFWLFGVALVFMFYLNTTRAKAQPMQNSSCSSL